MTTQRTPQPGCGVPETGDRRSQKSQSSTMHGLMSTSTSTSTSTHGSACITCRRRRRKCDKTLPSCYRCEVRGILCEGYVWRWAEAVSSNPSCAGKSRESFPQSRARKLSRLHPTQSPSLVSAEDVGGHGFASHCLHPFPGASASSPAEGSDSSSVISPTSLPNHSGGYNDGYLIDPATIPDGLGDLVNYGELSCPRCISRTKLIVDLQMPSMSALDSFSMLSRQKIPISCTLFLWPRQSPLFGSLWPPKPVATFPPVSATTACLSRVSASASWR